MAAPYAPKDNGSAGKAALPSELHAIAASGPGHGTAFLEDDALLQEVYGLGEAFLAGHEAVLVLDADGALSLVRRFSGCGLFTSRFRGGRMEGVLGCVF